MENEQAKQEVSANVSYEMEPDTATRTKRDCVCAGCFGELIVRYDAKKRVSRISCGTDGCTCPGFVTRKWVERAKARNLAEAAEARQVLSSAVPWLKSKKTAEQLLAELGG